MGAILTVVALALALSVVSVQETTASLGASDTRKRVLAFYYPWYGTPYGPSGRWLHWDPDQGLDGGWENYHSTNTPAIGYYDSGSENVIEQHIEWAKFAGIDGFISSWWGVGGYTDRNFEKLLEIAENEGFYATIYYEAADTKEQIVSDLTYIFENYTDSPAFLRVDGRPVIFIYGRVTNKFGSGAWEFVFDNLRRGGFDGFYVGDGFNLVYTEYFDGVHTYNPVSIPLEDIRNTYDRYASIAKEKGKIFSATVVPGFQRWNGEGHVTDREDGVYYWMSWGAAISCAPDWVLITSWNEWHEGSEIEPSENEVFPQQYLKQTRRQVDKWKGGIFQVENLRISKTEAEPGESTTVSATLRNTGEMEGSRQVDFFVNGEIIDNKIVTLSPGENEQVSFTVTREKPGTYKVAINGLTGDFTVKKSSDTVDMGGPTVGVFYYPWYRGQSGERALRYHLVPNQRPALGTDTSLYNSGNPDVIGQHIEWSRQAGIDVWFVSWWGPGGPTDVTLRNCISTHPGMDGMKYAILYESTGRLGSFSDPDYSNLIPDFKYLENNYFNDPNYYKINGRPVVFIYLSRVYFRNKGRDEIQNLRDVLPTNPYLIGDEIFGPSYSTTDVNKWDAISAYDAYGQSLGPYGSTHAAINRLEMNYDNAKSFANGKGVGFAPAICPGFNDRAVRYEVDHRGAPRYFEDEPSSQGGDVFREMIREVALPRLDPRADNLMLVTSFNEWWEDTQIEPTAGTGRTTSEDDSDIRDYTQGNYYTDYGTLYLDILAQVMRPWFVDADDEVGLSDLMAVARHFGEKGEPGWIPSDVDGDGEVGLSDLMAVARHFGETR